jgi:hypothetical protein
MHLLTHLKPGITRHGIVFKTARITKLTIVLIMAAVLQSAAKEPFRGIALEKSKISSDAALIKGKVTDEQGQPLQGATVLVKGTSNGTKTDAEGNFSINAASGDVLVISHVGMETSEVKLGGQANISITLKRDILEDNEVLVVGYGTQKKKDLTGDVVRVNMAEKANQANVNLLQALVGTSAGVNLEERGGASGEPTLSIGDKLPCLPPTDR